MAITLIVGEVLRRGELGRVRASCRMPLMKLQALCRDTQAMIASPSRAPFVT